MKKPINKYSKNALNVAELFAGVGGFRLGLENVKDNKGKSPYKTVWANQWEPSTKTQHAADVYIRRFGNKHFSNQDISKVHFSDIPDHDLLVGGFPCQDYSVARTLSQAHGIAGKKGVLWWEIHRILSKKEKKPKYLFLENVDRLLKSPAKQRGRDFAIILASLSDLGYAVEWRVINAADYGMPQRRRRIFFLGYHQSTPIYKKISKSMNLAEWLFKDGVIAKAFPVKSSKELVCSKFMIEGKLSDISEGFNRATPNKSLFSDTGVMIKRTVLTQRTEPDHKGKRILLKDILLPDDDIPSDYFVHDGDLPKWKYVKGAKNEVRVNTKTGFKYTYDEGPMVFPDALDRPSRTIVTGEGGSTPSRFKHVVAGQSGRLRRLTPVELEKLNMFPVGHTEGVSDVKRAFFMGNALVVGVVEKIGHGLMDAINGKN